MEQEKQKGTVIFFQGFWGFIAQDNGEKDMFVHWSDINVDGHKALKKDQRVSYLIGTNNMGQPKAIDVTIDD